MVIHSVSLHFSNQRCSAVSYEPYLAHVMFWREFLQVDALPIPNPPIYPGLGPALRWAGLPPKWLG